MSRPALTVLAVLAAVALAGSAAHAAPAQAALSPAAPDRAAAAPADRGVERGSTTTLDAALAAAGVPDSVAGWHVDEKTGAVVVSVVGTGDAKSTAFVARAASVSGGPVRTITGVERPGLLWDLIAGQAITQSSGRCSLGANATTSTGVRVVITAGHCTAGGGNWSGTGGTIGPVSGSSFPGNDFGTIRVSSTSALPTWFVDRFGTIPDVIIIGHRAARVGERVCRSGSTTGWRCGTVAGLNATVNYAGGTVYGLIRTNVCAEPGDSGGPLVSYPDAMNQVYLLGVLSGGSGNCSSGGTTFYQPIAEILNAYGLTLRVRP